jgi:hypothetical protein
MRPQKTLQQFQWCRISGFGVSNETSEEASAASMRPPKRLWRFQWDRGIHKKFQQHYFTQKGSFQHKTMSKKVWLRLNETAEADSEVSMKPPKRIRRPQWDHWSGISGVNETAEADSAVSMRPRNTLWHCGRPCENEYWLSIPLKGYYSKNKYMLKHYVLIVTRKRKW